MTLLGKILEMCSIPGTQNPPSWRNVLTPHVLYGEVDGKTGGASPLNESAIRTQHATCYIPARSHEFMPQYTRDETQGPFQNYRTIHRLPCTDSRSAVTPTIHNSLLFSNAMWLVEQRPMAEHLAVGMPDPEWMMRCGVGYPLNRISIVGRFLQFLGDVCLFWCFLRHLP